MSPPSSPTCSCNARTRPPFALRSKVGAFERVATFQHGFRCEQPRFSIGSHGVGGLDLHFAVIGPRGAVAFDVMSHWIPGALKDEGRPTAGAIDYHSRAPMREGHEAVSECVLIGGPCYGDVWFSGGTRALEILVEHGEEALFQFLESEHDTRFPEVVPLAK